MSRFRTVALIGSLLALAVLATAGPAAAHLPASVTLPERPAPDLPHAPLAALVGAASPDSAGAPAWVVVAGALPLGMMVARRRPRRAVILALVLLLTLFAFENALHSVHHGLDAKQSGECTIAAASAHLSAVSVDDIADTSVILAVSGTPAEPDRSPAPTRLLGPDQGRAPPVPTA